MNVNNHHLHQPSLPIIAFDSWAVNCNFFSSYMMEARFRLRPRKETPTEKPARTKRSRTTTATRGRKRTRQQSEPPPQDEIELDNEDAQPHYSPSKISYSRRNARSSRKSHPMNIGDAVETSSSLPSIVQVQGGHKSDDDNSSQIYPNTNENEMGESQRRAIIRVRLSNLRGLREATDELVSSIRNHNEKSSRSSSLDLDVKRGVLESRLIAYREDRKDFFIQPSLFEELAEPDLADVELVGEDLDISHVLGNANLAAALNLLHRIRSGEVEQEQVLSSLIKLDAFYAELFAPFGEGSQNLREGINLRTSVFIHKLSSISRGTNPYQVMADVFCGASNAEQPIDYQTLFEKGPFRRLGKVDGQKSDSICIERVRKIVELLKYERENPGSLAEKFVTDDILWSVEEWIWEVYQANKNEVNDRKAETQRAAAASEGLHDAEERSRAEDTESAAESQPIMRLEESQPRQSLFQGAQSLAVLHGISQSIERLEELQPRKSLFQGAQSFEALLNAARSPNETIPPSNQQQESQGAPSDYDHDNAAILGPPPSSNNRAIPREPSASADPSARGEPQHHVDPLASDDDEADDDDDPFEQDSRPGKDKETVLTHYLGPKQARRSKPAQLMPPPPRPSLPQSTPASTAHQRPLPSQPSSSFQSVPTASETRSVFGASQSYRSRQAWSADDTDLLINLIRIKQARWAKIEHENDRFEHPRNQQAYRDKARNLKVEYLLYDRVLPPCFDLVALSKKEVERLISFGKNPFRREDDLDDDGNPVGTEYARPDEL